MTETIYILLPVHNRREVTRRFVKCLAGQSYPDYHLVLIDDGSTDGTAEMVKSAIASVTVITGAGNWWWGGALHEGYTWLRKRNPLLTDIVLIINDDTEFDGRFLEAAAAFLGRHKKTLLLAECYGRENNRLIDAGVHVDWKRLAFERPSEQKPVNCLSTRGLFLRVEDFFATGGFHPRLLPHYLADYEFTIRAHRKGMQLATHPSIKVWLDQSATGHHGIENKTVSEAVKTVFTRKSAINPLALFVFIALACPWFWKVPCWIRIASRSFLRGWTLLRRRPAVL